MSRSKYRKAVTQDLEKFDRLRERCQDFWQTAFLTAQLKEIPLELFPCRECPRCLACAALGRVVSDP